MSKMTGNYPHQGLKQAIYLMKTRFSSRFRFDLPLPPLVAVTCSALPYVSNPAIERDADQAAFLRTIRPARRPSFLR
jgi:hypothetical protein